MALSSTTNNPGNLTVGGLNSNSVYPGQNGVYAANGMYYATFPDAATGSNALVDYVDRHIDNNGWNTTSNFVSGYLGTSTGNAANPYPQNYLATVNQATGLGGATLTAANGPTLAAAIAKAEGSSNFNLGSFAQSAGLPTTINSLESDAAGLVTTATNFATDPVGSITSILGDTTSSLFQPLIDYVQKSIVTPLENFFSLSKGPWLRIALVVIGGALVIMALVSLLASNPTVQKVAKTAALAAA